MTPVLPRSTLYMALPRSSVEALAYIASLLSASLVRRRVTWPAVLFSKHDFLCFTRLLSCTFPASRRRLLVPSNFEQPADPVSQAHTPPCSHIERRCSRRGWWPYTLIQYRNIYLTRCSCDVSSGCTSALRNMFSRFAPLQVGSLGLKNPKP